LSRYIVRAYRPETDETFVLFAAEAMGQTVMSSVGRPEDPVRVSVPGLDPAAVAALTAVDREGRPVLVLTARLVYEVDLFGMPGDPRLGRALIEAAPVGRDTLLRLPPGTLPAPTEMLCSAPAELTAHRRLLEKLSFVPESERLIWFRSAL
jgi:hypothetical protein